MKLINYMWTLFGMLLLAACTDPMGDIPGDGEGELRMGSLQISAEVFDDNGSASRATGTFPSAPRPEELTLRILIPGSNTVVYEKAGPLTAPVKLATGEYLLECTYGENKAGLTPYLYHQETFRIAKGQTTHLTSVQVGLGCAMIRAQVDEALWQQLGTTPSITLISGNDVLPLERNQECFVPAGKPYTLKLEGTDILSQPWSYEHQRTEADTQAKYRYTLTFQINQPVFQLPAQPAGNAWSKHLYITPVGESDIIADAGIRQKLLTEMQYDVSVDGVHWQPATREGEHWIARGLTPSTTYSVRARFQHFTVSTNTQALTTESADVLPDGELDAWSSEKIHSKAWLAAWDTDLFKDNCAGWATNNEASTEGASGASSIDNYALHWRWHSTTLYREVANRGKIAELVTTAFYNQPFSLGTTRDEILKMVKENHRIFTGLLKKEKVAHATRPVSLSFDYTYAPVAGDHGIAYAKVYDASGREIAVTEPFTMNAQADFTTQTLKLNYTDVLTKMATLTVYFESGSDKDANKMTLIQQEPNITPFKHDYVAGSILQLDHIVLNYE